MMVKDVNYIIDKKKIKKIKKINEDEIIECDLKRRRMQSKVGKQQIMTWLMCMTWLIGRE